MRTGLVAALACAALALTGCAKAVPGTAQAGHTTGSAVATAPTASSTTLLAPTSELPTADTPASIPSVKAPLPSRATPLPSTVTCAYTPDEGGAAAAKPVQPPNTKSVSTTGTVSASLITSVGQVTITLNRALAPCTVNSFVSLAKQGFYDNTPCHRLTTAAQLQVLQCGDPTGQGTGGPGYSFKDELFAGLTYGRGIVAMANAGPDTNGSQFFIIYGDSSGLQPNYTVFGSVDDPSLQVIDTVARAGVNPTNGPGDGSPIIPVTISTATVAS